jgi:hypothetical protein
MMAVTPAPMVTEGAIPALSDACSCGSWSRQGAETTQDRGWFASRCPRCVGNACASLRGGLNRSAVGKTAISARGRPQPHAAPALTSLAACNSTLRRAILRQGDAEGRPGSAPSLRGGLAHRLACARYPSIQSTYSKGRASRGFVLRGCIRKAGGARCEAALRHGLADTRFFTTRSQRSQAAGEEASPTKPVPRFCHRFRSSR